jgi:hypothetical protein
MQVWIRRLQPHGLYVNLVVHRDCSSPNRTSSTSTTSCAATTRLTAAAALLQLCRAFGCLDTSRGSSSTTSPTRASGCHNTSRGSSSTTSPRAGLSSTTSPTLRVWVPRHVTRLIVDYFASRRLVVDYFAYAARPGASAHRAARRRLLRRRRASGCLGTSRGSSRGSSSTTSPRAGLLSTTSLTPRVRVPQHVARLVVDHFASHRLRREAHRRLLRPRCASRCLGTSRGSSSTISPHAGYDVDYFAYAAHQGASARRAARRRLLR